MTRRTVLTPILAGLANAAHGLAKPALRALRPAVFSKHLQWLDIPAAAAFVREAGFTAIDLTVRTGGHVEPADVAAGLPRAAEAFSKAGVELAMITTGITKVTPEAEAIVKAMKAVGQRYYRWGGLRYQLDQPLRPQIAAAKTEARRLAELNAKHGVCGIYHTHSGLAQLGASIWDIHEIVRDEDPNHLAVNYDIAHATIEGGLGGWVHSAALLGAHLRGIALKDFRWEQDGKQLWQPVWCPLGEGMVNWPAFARLPQLAAFAGPMQIHFEYPIGGAEHGDRTIRWSRQQVATAMRRDGLKLASILGGVRG